MFYENFFKTTYKSRMKFTLSLFYCLMLIFIYSIFVISSRQNSVKWLQDDMQKRLSTTLSSIKAEYEKKIVDIKYLAQNNTLRMPFVYSTTNAVREVINSEIALHPGSYDNLIVMDNNKKVFFDSSGLDSPLQSKNMNTTSDWYVLQHMPVYMHYEPIDFGNRKIGSLYVYYKLSDFYNDVNEQLDNRYRIFGFSGGKALLLIDKTGVYQFNKSISSNLSESLKKQSLCAFKYNGVTNLVYSKLINVSNQKEPFILSIGIEERTFAQTQWKFIRSGLYMATLIAFILTVLLFLMYKAAFYYLDKDYSNKLEMQNLHAQRHDFSKHLNIISGMASYGDYEGLKQYMEQLGNNVVFTGNLLKLNCAPLSVLIQEKEMEAQEKGIIFEFIANTDFSNMKMTTLDLCMVTGNLLDNAIEANEAPSNSAKKVMLSYSQDEKFYIIKVSNTGTFKEKVDIERIFESGYSTKKGQKGRGMGLYIVKSTLKKYHGFMQVENSNGMICFTAYFPLQI